MNRIKPVGWSRVFSEEEELSFVQHIIKMADYGFPVTELDFKMIVKSYLDKRVMNIRVFKDNMPGNEWCKSFLKRNQSLSTRFASNIKKMRAQVDGAVLESYFDCY